ncbi:aldehyde dehydrogenase family protein [Piscinibacter sakaiensis]|uniref:aldehyde dehydrogenase family protein n=1 Tax=Piscinibacter sakaiensis TaxID=1547922 RepID=UPI003AB09705
MNQQQQTYIDGAWTACRGETDTPVTDSYTGQVFASWRTNSPADVDLAVHAARRALDKWSGLPPETRIDHVRKVVLALRERADELTQSISREVGMPRKLAARIQVGAPIAAWEAYAEIARSIEWEQRQGHSLVQQLPVGVVACITPWNYPLHQITSKVAPALLAGCTVVLKPSELAPSSAFVLAQAIDQAGLPPGVFNLVHGAGADVGEALVRHPGVDMVSFTGSTRAGRHVAALASADVKRVALELGGKSAALVMPGADLAPAVKATLASCFLNSGQTCSATTRLLVPRESLERVAQLARDGVAAYVMGDPADPTTRLGPLISQAQRQKVLQMIDHALQQGAERWSPELPVPPQGFYVPPTVLGRVTPSMDIAREEVFGPVLVVIGYGDIDEAVAIANDTDYGLAATVWGATPAQALEVARRLRAGQVDVNGAPFNPAAPFGGFNKSGLGRENGRYGFEEFLEPRAVQMPASYFETTS